MMLYEGALVRSLLPEWLISHWQVNAARSFATREQRADLVIELSRLNVSRGTGGPFAAALFEQREGTLISVGVNRVVPLQCSSAHAEMLALTLGQQLVQNFDLGAAGLPEYELVSSTEPCAMCFGAIPWSGIRHLVCCALAEDAAAIGFDEGPRHPDWMAQLEQRGIRVSTGLCREAARQVLLDYQRQGGDIYNARQGGAGE